MPHIYDDRFFAWVNLTALRSARIVLPLVRACVDVRSVVDVGCGHGAWLTVWRELGVETIRGLDGSYVERNRLSIPPNCFSPVDLTGRFPLAERFDLAQSLEVAEHLPPSAARSFIEGLCESSDIVLFSAAQPGQGGEAHLNERSPSYWGALFRANGYEAFDAVRPQLAVNRIVAPWYKYNTVIYANAAGMTRLAPEALATRCDDLHQLDRAGNLAWTLRRLVLRPLPTRTVSWMSRARYRVACALSQGPRSSSVQAPSEARISSGHGLLARRRSRSSGAPRTK